MSTKERDSDYPGFVTVMYADGWIEVRGEVETADEWIASDNKVEVER